MEKEEAIDIYRRYNVAMATNDVATLEQLLTDDFTLTHMSGFVQSRAEWLHEITTGQMHYVASREEQVDAGPIAAGWQVRGHNVVTAAIHGGRENHWRLNTVMPITPAGRISRVIVTPY